MRDCDLRWLLLGLVLFVNLRACSSIKNDPGSHFVNSFVVRADGDINTANEIADSTGFRVKREIEDLGVFELFHDEVPHRDKRSSDHIHHLKNHPKVLHVEQQEALVRVKREMIYDKQLELPIRTVEDNSLYHRVPLSHVVKKGMGEWNKCPKFNDEYYTDQWSLCNYGQTTNGTRGIDLNVAKAWIKGFTGKGVVVCNLDDGLDHNHPDLRKNYDKDASADFNDKDDPSNDPMPNDKIPDNSHGTRCAGIIAAQANNGICGVGIAYNSNIGGIRILDGTVTDLLEAQALVYKLNYSDIISASWGPRDDGATMEAPRKNARMALERGVAEGRYGKGRIFVWATGNGGLHNDDCNADGYVSSIETLSVGSITEYGKKPYFMELCSSTLAVVPTGGEVIPHEDDAKKRNGTRIIRVVTTDLHKKCTESFEGTSAAAPMAAGCVALVLEANPGLGWRDIQHIVVRTARISQADGSWLMNGADFHVSHKYGFGVLDCGQMVELAQKWKNVPDQHICQSPTQEGAWPADEYHRIVQKIESNGCQQSASSRIDSLEHVQLHIKAGGVRRGNIQILLTSPAGTKSKMLRPRSGDNSRDPIDFVFMSVHHWGENPVGTWRLELINNHDGKATNDLLILKEWTIKLYGSATHSVGTRDPHKVGQRAWYPTHDDLEKMMSEEKRKSDNVQIKRQGLAKAGERRKLESFESKLKKSLNDFLSEQKFDNDIPLERKRVHSLDSGNDLHNDFKRFHATSKSNQKSDLYSDLISEIDDYLAKRENKLSKVDERNTKKKKVPTATLR